MSEQRIICSVCGHLAVAFLGGERKGHATVRSKSSRLRRGYETFRARRLKTSRPRKMKMMRTDPRTLKEWTRSDIQRLISSTTKGGRPLPTWVSEVQSIVATRSLKPRKPPFRREQD